MLLFICLYRQTSKYIDGIIEKETRNLKFLYIFNSNLPGWGQLDPLLWFFEKCIFYREGGTLDF